MFRRFTILFILLITVTAVSAQDKTSIAVWDFEAMGLNSQEVDILSRRVVSLLVSTNQYIVTDRNNMKAILEEQSFQASGCASNECIVEIGQLLGVQKMLSGSIGKFGSVFTIELYLIDIQTGQIQRSANHDIIGEMELLLTEGIGTALNKLLGESSEPVQTAAPMTAAPTQQGPVKEEPAAYVTKTPERPREAAARSAVKKKPFMNGYIGIDSVIPSGMGLIARTDLNLTQGISLSAAAGYNVMAYDADPMVYDVSLKFFFTDWMSADVGLKYLETEEYYEERDGFGSVLDFSYYNVYSSSYSSVSLYMSRIVLTAGIAVVTYDEYDLDDIFRNRYEGEETGVGFNVALSYRIF